MSDGLSLYTIAAGLAELVQAREDLLDPERETPADPAEIAEVEKALHEYLKAEVRKVDGVHGFLRACDQHVKAAREESRFFSKRAAAIEETAKRVKTYVAGIMREFGEKSLSGNAGRRLLVKGNGGLQPLHVQGWDSDSRQWTGESPLPEEFIDVTITLPANVISGGLRLALAPFLGDADREPAQDRIRKALGDPCPACEGAGKVPSPAGSAADSWPCPDCGASGKAAVPGASLGERGVHLEVK